MLNRYTFFTAALCMLIVLPGLHVAQAQGWTNNWSKDEMTGERKAFAFSPDTSPTKPLDFPYTGITASLAFGCDTTDEWAYIVFSEKPNLANTKAQSGGYSTFSTRVRWDDNVKTVGMSQEWGARFIHFQSDSNAIANMQGAEEALVELNWYGSGKVYFPFSLQGSADAIASARKSCNSFS